MFLLKKVIKLFGIHNRTKSFGCSNQGLFPAYPSCHFPEMYFVRAILSLVISMECSVFAHAPLCTQLHLMLQKQVRWHFLLAAFRWGLVPLLGASLAPYIQLYHCISPAQFSCSSLNCDLLESRKRLSFRILRVACGACLCPGTVREPKNRERADGLQLFMPLGYGAVPVY